VSRREVKEPVGCEQAPMRDPYHRREIIPVACRSASKPHADSQARCSRQATRKLSPCSPALGHRWGTARIETDLPAPKKICIGLSPCPNPTPEPKTASPHSEECR